MAEGEVRARRRGRRWAMKALFMWDAQGGGEAEALVEAAARMEAVAPEREASAARDPEAAAFARALVAGAVDRREVIDPLLDAVAPDWGVARMAAVDRAILRLGAYELMYTDTPAAVAVAEAVELARQYSTAESPRFVNGVLGALAPRPAGAGGAAHTAAAPRGQGGGA
ncbi:MAG: transcription antitermination factor NusB [Firmicutes bacterium]|nr:transcription antitermination factor NusB [Bacillota bacterium]